MKILNVFLIHFIQKIIQCGMIVKDISPIDGNPIRDAKELTIIYTSGTTGELKVLCINSLI